MLKTYLRLRIKTDKTFFFIICQESKSKGKQTHFCKINSRFVDLELGAWCACDRKLLILFLPIFFQNITIKLWMWPLTNDLILKDPISSSKSTKKAWKKDFPFQFWLWPSTCQLMLKDFAGAEITDKPVITANFSCGKPSYWQILQNCPKNVLKMSPKLFSILSLKLPKKIITQFIPGTLQKLFQILSPKMSPKLSQKLISVQRKEFMLLP